LTQSRQPASSRHLEQGVSVEILPRQPRVEEITGSHHGDDHVRISISVTNQSWCGGRTPPEEFSGLGQRADDAGLEAYALLGFLANQTRRVRLRALVSNVTLRPPALLIMTVSTLDALSRGRAGTASVPGTPARKSPFVGRHSATVMPDPWDRG
jgi:alkanesulfonate monooxygenase SsuD/methylene tetrahydromethanopterin reductase-like flavin-dependent oxidoreductase (luciferase family)